jgi:hypothetical protein
MTAWVKTAKAQTEQKLSAAPQEQTFGGGCDCNSKTVKAPAALLVSCGPWRE